MNQGNSALNASSLIDLKAELHKKYESFRNVKLKQPTPHSSKATHFKIKGEIIKEKKNKPNVSQSKEAEPEEDLALKKSREALEAKAKLYEKIMTNKVLIDEEQKECYLVDFQRKVLYSSTEPTVMENNEEKSSSNVAFKENKLSAHENFEFTCTSKQTLENAEDEDPNQPIHYQNIQFNEVRDHGTGYFAFSTNESKRKEQMEELKTLRRETEEERIKHKKIQMKRNSMLQARLKKICERKNIDPSVLESFNKNPETGNIEMSKDNIDIASIPLPEMIAPELKSPNEVKLPKIRPWDIGKDNLQQFIPAKKIRSQEQWIEEKREERQGEFAPPSTYL